jgi:L-amino acid N-acyltransferase
MMRLVECSLRHAPAILGILNDAILHSTVVYDYRPRTMEMMEAWFEAKAKGRYPIIGAEEENGELVGFASYGPFRPWPAYKYSVEHSVYVDAPFRGKGVGRRLMLELIESAKAQDYHMMIGGIDAANTASVALHRDLGFQFCGTVKEAGFKFGRWLDLDFYQLILPTPAHPVDG